MGKTDKRRPSQVGREEEQLRWLLFQQRITFKEYEIKYKQLRGQGKITRGGKPI